MTAREAVLEAVAGFAAATDAPDWTTLRMMLTEDAAAYGDYDDTWLRGDGGWLLARRWFEVRISLRDVGVLRPAP